MSTGAKIVGGIVLVILIGALITTVNEQGDDYGSNYSGTTSRSGGSVTYSVTGTARRVSLTYENDSGGTEQHEVSLPWSKTYTGFTSELDFLYVSAQNQRESGTLQCEVKIGGRVIYSGDASGAY